MKRRDAIRLFPFSIAGIASLSHKVYSGEISTNNHDGSNGLPLALQYTKRLGKD